MNYASLVLYAILGVVLAICGVGVVTEPLKFIAIMFNVILIDFVGNRK